MGLGREEEQLAGIDSSTANCDCGCGALTVLLLQALPTFTLGDRHRDPAVFGDEAAGRGGEGRERVGIAGRLLGRLAATGEQTECEREPDA